MSRHLTSHEISQAIAGLENRVAQDHLDGCRVCRAEVEQFRTDLRLFGSAVRDWSERMPTARRPAARSPRLWVGFAYASILLMLLAVGLTLPRLRNTPSDAVLLQEVSTELSRTVPGPMEPLLSGSETSSSTAQ